MLNYTIVFMKKCCNNTIITKDLWQQQKLKNGLSVAIIKPWICCLVLLSKFE